MAFVEWTANAVPLLAVQYADGSLVSSSRPLHAGNTVSLYLTGLGRKAKTFTEGAAPKATAPAVEVIQINVQGMAAQILYDGCTAFYPGFDQINIRLPSYTLPAGASTVTVQIVAPSAGQTLTYQVPAN